MLMLYPSTLYLSIPDAVCVFIQICYHFMLEVEQFHMHQSAYKTQPAQHLQPVPRGSIFVEVSGFLLSSICCQFQTKRLTPLCCFFVICLACCRRLPIPQPGPDDGFIELGNLSLQHRPQVLSEPFIVLLQLLLVVCLVRCDQVLVLLNCLAASITQTKNMAGKWRNI